MNQMKQIAIWIFTIFLLGFISKLVSTIFMFGWDLVL